MFGFSKRRIQAIQTELSQLKFDLANPQKYIKGQKLKDGTIITSVKKEYWDNQFTSVKYPEANYYDWQYEGVKNGKIINVE